MSNPLCSSECWAFAQKAVQHMKKNKTNQLNQNKQFNKTILRLRNNTNLSIVQLRACGICIWFPWLSWPLTCGILLLRPLQHNHITTDVHCSFPNAYMINTGGQNMIFDLITSALICHLKINKIRDMQRYAREKVWDNIFWGKSSPHYIKCMRATQNIAGIFLHQGWPQWSHVSMHCWE